jgi:hypothetical protein
MNKLTKRSTIAIVILLAILLLVIDLKTRPQQVPGQAPLADISNIQTLRSRFNQDVGKTRLIILVSPT